MRITHARGHLCTGRSRLPAATLAAVICLTLTFAIGGTATANAAGPATIGPDADVIFPTWFGGRTTVCATNRGACVPSKRPIPATPPKGGV